MDIIVGVTSDIREHLSHFCDKCSCLVKVSQKCDTLEGTEKYLAISYEQDFDEVTGSAYFHILPVFLCDWILLHLSVSSLLVDFFFLFFQPAEDTFFFSCLSVE